MHLQSVLQGWEEKARQDFSMESKPFIEEEKIL